MGRSRASALVRVVTAVAGLGVVIPSAALVGGGIADTSASDTTYGDVSASFALLEIVVGVALLAAALMLLSERSTATLGRLAVLTAAAWFAPVWVGWEGGSDLVRSVGGVVAPLLPVVILAVAATVPPRAVGIGRFALVLLAGVAALATTGASIALALVRDPIRDLYCWSDCTVNAFLVHDDVQLEHRMTWIVLGLGAASGVVAALIGAVRLSRAAPLTRRGSGPALAATSLAGLALAAYALSLHFGPRETPDRPLYEWLFVVRAAGLLALAAGLVWLSLRPRLVRGLVTRLAVDLERSAAEGGHGRLLARALGDPGLRLAYPVGPGERVVDADGHPVALHPSRNVMQILAGEEVVALVESAATTVEALERALGPAARLALGNERLRAEALVRLDDATRSRARIVETADAARRRMERDLHDGAQQRLLALTYDLRIAMEIAESSSNERASTPLRVGLNRAVTASEEVRDIAHGIFPAELTTYGLTAALESLADVRPLRLAVELPADRRYRSDVEIAAYAVAVEAVDVADATLTVAASELDGSLRLVLEGVDNWGDRLVYVEDRISAAGGTLTVEDGKLHALLPCA